MRARFFDFSCNPDDVTQTMIDDVVAELLNMLAGQIAGALAYRYSVGLPRRTTLIELLQSKLVFDQAVLLRSEGKVDLGLWLLEENLALSEGAALPSIGNRRRIPAPRSCILAAIAVRCVTSPAARVARADATKRNRTGVIDLQKDLWSVA